MKRHRWVADVRVACNVLKNEDGRFYLQTAGTGVVSDYPMRIWCYDCEREATSDFGTACGGFLVPGGKDESWPDTAWEGLI